MKQQNKLIISIFIIFSITFYNIYLHMSTRSENIIRPSLTNISLQYETDKSPLVHNFTWIYEQFISKWRDEPIRLLEVGLWKGGSVMLWENYFPNAELHFIDITDKYLIYKMSNRSKLHILDQSNVYELEKFATQSGSFDIIIDDGGHQMEEQIKTFQTFFKLVKPGGIYVIEDLHTSYWKQYGSKGSLKEPKSNSQSMINFLKDMVDSVNSVGANTGFGATGNLTSEMQEKLDYYEKTISSIQFFNSICFILKKL